MSQYDLKKEEESLSQRSPFLKDVMVISVNREDQETIELVQNVDLTEAQSGQGVQLKTLISILKDYHFELNNCQISYYLQLGDIYVNCGVDPISENIYIEPLAYTVPKEITLRVRASKSSLIHKLMSEEVNQTMLAVKQMDSIEDNHKCRRIKQRRIGFIIKKVHQWRKLYSDDSAKLSLEEAAKQVGISKKSLDDYLLQIKLGRKYNFNFEEHKHDKVGMLRDFVRKRKKCQKGR